MPLSSVIESFELIDDAGVAANRNSNDANKTIIKLKSNKNYNITMYIRMYRISGAYITIIVIIHTIFFKESSKVFP